MRLTSTLILMTKCNYCGRENKEAVGPCHGCGTPLEPDQSASPVRRLTAKEMGRGWKAVALGVICAVVGWILAWRTSQILRLVGEVIVLFGFEWTFLTLAELRNRKGNAQGNGTNSA